MDGAVPGGAVPGGAAAGTVDRGHGGLRAWWTPGVSTTRRALALGGIAGPVGFTAAWVTAGLTGEASPVTATVSRLAAHGASTRPVMTAGLVTLGLGLGGYALALRDDLEGAAWVAALASGLGALGAAAAPLASSEAVDRLHAVVAIAGSACLAATPALAAPALARQGRAAAARASLGTAVGAAILLLAAAGPVAPGLLQRAGLLSGQGWVVASAVAMVKGGSVPQADRGAPTRPG